MDLFICTCILLPGGLYMNWLRFGVFIFPGRPRLNADCWLSRQLCRLLLSRQTVSTIHYSIPYHTYILYSMNTIYTFTIPSSIHVQLYMLSLLLPRQTGGGSDKGKST